MDTRETKFQSTLGIINRTLHFSKDHKKIINDLVTFLYYDDSKNISLLEAMSLVALREFDNLHPSYLRSEAQPPTEGE